MPVEKFPRDFHAHPTTVMAPSHLPRLVLFTRNPLLSSRLRRALSSSHSLQASREEGAAVLVASSWAEGAQALERDPSLAAVVDLSTFDEESPLIDSLDEWATLFPAVRAFFVDAEGAPLQLAERLAKTNAFLSTVPANAEQWSRWLQRLAQQSAGIGRLAQPFFLKGTRATVGTRMSEFAQSLEEIGMMAEHDVTILLLGETGSGKTTLARLIHDLSPRSESPFLTLACGAMQPTLFESELFGHVRGAFTGADQNKAGKLEAVGDGTLLLDEIDTLTLDMQIKLLRVLETGEYEPVGSNETKRCRARLVVASNLCLETLIASNRFRSDLYYRLNVLKFQLPPLREREHDLVAMAIEWIQTCSVFRGVRIDKIQTEVLDAIQNYAWPGNIREMKNCIERAVLLCRDGVLATRQLPPAMLPANPQVDRQSTLTMGPAVARVRETLEAKVSDSERAIIIETLARHHNNRTRVAKELGISRVTLYNKLRKYGLMEESESSRAETARTEVSRAETARIDSAAPYGVFPREQAS